ncbi:MAG TPA: thiamine pyrophosphate-binding protein, partial [Anaerolineae bacterium]|nr:thiamine pyrophosphate-binding protein [Anaerolineae bacterium]
CGGHISPILIGADQAGIRVVDTRHEASAVFAADATARLTGMVGVAAVTAGPGVTNAITALKNAQMAQSPLLLLGGAAATLLKGRGALQDIDHLGLVKGICKWSATCKTVREIVPTLEKAFRKAMTGVPGPVFVELPVDLLYPERVVREWTLEMAKGKGLSATALQTYLKTHLKNKFAGAWRREAQPVTPPKPALPPVEQWQRVAKLLASAEKPLLTIGSQAMLNAPKAQILQEAVIKLGIPTYLSGMARGLLGKHKLHMRHKRSKALREADVIVLAGVSADFRLGYGASIPRSATYISINRSKHDLYLNRKPTVPILADPGTFLRTLATYWDTPPLRWQNWYAHLQARETARDAEIAATAAASGTLVNPVRFLQQLEEAIAEDSVIIGDGGDFVGTASYILRPRAPLSWLDPGAFGTLGSGGGFALAAGVIRPKAEIWLLYGDGSCGYSIAEFDTYARHGIPVIAIVGNDAGWTQIAREQIPLFGTALSTELARSDYHIVAQGYGAVGLLIDKPEQVK